MTTPGTSRHFHVLCDDCGAHPPDDALRCRSCGGTLSFEYDKESVSWDGDRRGLWRYWPLLPLADPDAAVTLGEGATPLLPSRMHPDRRVFLKDEMRNPTGSHKDRQVCVAISHARALGRRTSVLVSAGSTGISNAAYAARAGLDSTVFMSEGVPAERAYPVFALGSRIVEVRGQIDALIDRLDELAVERGLYHSSTARTCNPYQAEGAKTIAFEIVEQLGRAPDWLVLPVGGGGTLAAMWRGMTELHDRSMIDHLPRLIGVTSRRWNALERAFELGYRTHEELRTLPDEGPVTPVQGKLAHAYPPDGPDALAAVRASGGWFLSTTDEEALTAQARCGAVEGLYVEPSTGTALAGLESLLASGHVGRDDSVVALASGSGFRETALAMELRPLERETIDLADLDGLLGRIEV